MSEHPDDPERRGLPIGALARGCGAKVETVRYYERIGLLPRPARTSGGHRVYGHAHLRRLGFIRRARELGFTVEAVRELLALSERCYIPCAEARALAVTHLADVRAKLESLRAMEASLSSVVARCQPEEAVDCPLLDALWEPLSSTTDPCGVPSAGP